MPTELGSSRKNKLASAEFGTKECFNKFYTTTKQYKLKVGTCYNTENLWLWM